MGNSPEEVLIHAILNGLPRGTSFVTLTERRKREKEAKESRRRCIDGLFHAVIKARILSEMTGRPAQLEHADLRLLERILVGLLIELDGRRAGRRARDHRLMVADFLLRQQTDPGIALKRLHADVATDWNTTASNVKKLIAINRRAALAWLQKIDHKKAAETVQAATNFLRRYRN